MDDYPKVNPSMYLEFFSEMFEQRVPFNRLLGMKVIEFGERSTKIGIDMRKDFVGNFMLETLHGGVIFSVLDVVGGMTSAAGLLNKLSGKPQKDIIERFIRIGTIDMRIDFLRPGRGNHFIANGTTLRTGNKVAVNRMEFINNEEVLIAVGTGTYLVG